jgi:hypothetical protein
MKERERKLRKDSRIVGERESHGRSERQFFCRKIKAPYF